MPSPNAANEIEVYAFLRDMEESAKAAPEGQPRLRQMVHSGWDGQGGYWGGAGGWGGLLLGNGGRGLDHADRAGDLSTNATVAACLRVLEDNFPQPELRIQGKAKAVGKARDSETVKVDHALVKLNNRPNPAYDRYTFWGAMVKSAVVDGNAYALKIRSRAKIPVQLWWVPPWMMTPRWDPAGTEWVGWYEYRVNGRIYAVDPSDVIHWGYGTPDPRNDRLSISKLRAAAARSVSSLNEVDAFTAFTLINGGVPSIAIRPKENIPPPNPEQAERMRQDWKQLTQGSRKGEPFIAGGYFDVVPIGFSPEQLALDKIPARLEDQICALTGVNAMVAGVTSGAQHKTYCLPADARVWTPAGPVRIADIGVGQKVWSLVDGGLEPRTVLRSGKTGNKPLLEIRTKNRVLRATDNHPVLVRVPGTIGGANRVAYEWRPAGQLKVGDHVVQAKSVPDQPASLMPNGKPASRDLMQFLGAVVGDGTVVDIRNRQRLIMSMPSNDRSGAWYREASPRLFTKSGGAAVAVRDVPRAFEFCSKPAVEDLVTLGFGGRAKTKRIPGWVFAQPRAMRLAFLAGLVDTDGSINKLGSLAFAFCNQDLTLDVRDLLISVGVQCSNLYYYAYGAECLPNPGKQERYDSWRFVVSSAVQVAEIPFTDPLYRERVEFNAQRHRSDGFDAAKAGLSADLGFYEIRSITDLPAEDVFDIEVEDGHSFVADGVVVHNSNVQESRRALYEDTLIPMQARLAECLEHQILGDPGMGDPEKEEIVFWYGDIPCLQEDQDKLWTRMGTAFKDGLITRAVAKGKVGLDYDDKDDDVYVDVGTIPGDPEKAKEEEERKAAMAQPKPGETGPPGNPKKGPKVAGLTNTAGPDRGTRPGKKSLPPDNEAPLRRRVERLTAKLTRNLDPSP
jgi:HK97 family phage portal protein